MTNKVRVNKPTNTSMLSYGYKLRMCYMYYSCIEERFGESWCTSVSLHCMRVVSFSGAT